MAEKEQTMRAGSFNLFAAIISAVLLAPGGARATPTRVPSDTPTGFHALTAIAMSNYIFQETVLVPADGTQVMSITILEQGGRYRLLASGLLTAHDDQANPFLNDAEYGFDLDRTFVSDNCDPPNPDVDLGIGVNDTVNDDNKFPTWGPAFKETHLYAIDFLGEGAPIGLNYHDCLYSDNVTSFIVVSIFRRRDDCDLALKLERLILRAGEQLRVSVALDHRRPETVTVPLLLWITDATGREVARRTGQSITMEPGDRIERMLAVALPADLPPGEYEVLVGVEKMQQGIAGASRQFEIVE